MSPLAKGAPLRTFAVCAAVAVGVLVFTQFLLPGSPGSPGRGTPTAVLFSGLVVGLINSLTAAALILVYRTQRVINFAQTAIGVAGATFVFDMVQLTPVPFVIVFPIGLVIAGAIGALFELAIVRRFFYASRLVLTVATIAAASLIATYGNVVVRLLPFIPYERASLTESVGTGTVRRQLPFAGFNFHVGHLELRFGFAEVFAIEMALLALVLVGAFFRYTRAGVAVRALAENAERSSLLGINVGSLSLIIWTIAGLLGGLSAILTGAVVTPGAAQGIAPGVLLPALAAAVLARFKSLPVAVFAAVSISIVGGATSWSLRDDLPLVTVGLFVVIAGGLLLQRALRGRSEDGGGVSWQAVEEQRSIPVQLARLGSVRAARVALLAVGLILLVGYPFVVSTGPTVLGGNVAITSIIVLSLVILTGWSGQVSLGQYGFAAIGAVVSSALTAKVGIPFWISAFLGAACTAGVAALIGIPALRIRGLFLAVTTFAFGLAVTAVLFNNRYFGWLLPTDVARPRLFFIDFEDEQSMYYLCVAALALSVLFVSNLRRSRFGRVLIALRENENNVQAFGINLVRTKLLAFAVSGGLAGFAGAILAVQQRGVTVDLFGAQRSIDVFLYSVLGGVSSIAGSLIGSLYYSLVNFFNVSNPVLNQMLKGSGTFFVLLLLVIAPGGIISLVNRMRDGVLRIIAQRRQIVVPSLFADYDPEALERRLIPLAESSMTEGLAALPIDQRYTYPSELYAGSGDRVIDRLGPAKTTKEASALTAASKAFEDSDLVDVLQIPSQTGVPTS